MVVTSARDRQSAGVTLFLQALPLLALVALLGSGRAGVISACLIALLLSLPAVFIAMPNGAVPLRFLAGFTQLSLTEGLWLAAIPVGIILGGLVFHEAAGSGTAATTSANPVDVLFTGAFLLGGFTETVTGFGVGAVFAVAAFRSVGVTGVPAAGLALFSQMLIPWGGLGPGTAVGAALAGVDAQAMAARNAWILAAELPLLLPLFWHVCARAGHPVPARRRLGQLGWVLAEGALLVTAHHFVAWEVCGLLATGLTLAARLLWLAPPRGRDGWRHAIATAAPYLLLAGVLLGSRLWHDAPALAPLPGMPSLPLNHAVVGLWLVALGLVVWRGNARLVVAALLRGRRPALALVMFVLLARVLAHAGVPQALAGALAGAFGTAAPFASPLLAGIAGFLAGSNVGSNSAMMPLQAALGRMAGLGPVVLPAVQNGTLFLILSPQVCAIAGGLAGGGATPGRIWRLMWPVFPLALAVGLAAVAIR